MVPVRATLAAHQVFVKNPAVFVPRPISHVNSLSLAVHDGATMMNSGCVPISIPLRDGCVVGMRPEFPPGVITPGLAEKIITGCWYVAAGLFDLVVATFTRHAAAWARQAR